MSHPSDNNNSDDALLRALEALAADNDTAELADRQQLFVRQARAHPNSREFARRALVPPAGRRSAAQMAARGAGGALDDPEATEMCAHLFAAATEAALAAPEPNIWNEFADAWLGEREWAVALPRLPPALQAAVCRRRPSNVGPLCEALAREERDALASQALGRQHHVLAALYRWLVDATLAPRLGGPAPPWPPPDAGYILQGSGGVVADDAAAILPALVWHLRARLRCWAPPTPEPDALAAHARCPPPASVAPTARLGAQATMRACLLHLLAAVRLGARLIAARRLRDAMTPLVPTAPPAPRNQARDAWLEARLSLDPAADTDTRAAASLVLEAHTVLLERMLEHALLRLDAVELRGRVHDADVVVDLVMRYHGARLARRLFRWHHDATHQQPSDLHWRRRAVCPPLHTLEGGRGPGDPPLPTPDDEDENAAHDVYALARRQLPLLAADPAFEPLWDVALRGATVHAAVMLDDRSSPPQYDPAARRRLAQWYGRQHLEDEPDAPPRPLPDPERAAQEYTALAVLDLLRPLAEDPDLFRPRAPTTPFWFARLAQFVLARFWRVGPTGAPASPALDPAIDALVSVVGGDAGGVRYVMSGAVALLHLMHQRAIAGPVHDATADLRGVSHPILAEAAWRRAALASPSPDGDNDDHRPLRMLRAGIAVALHALLAAPDVRAPPGTAPDAAPGPPFLVLPDMRAAVVRILGLPDRNAAVTYRRLLRCAHMLAESVLWFRRAPCDGTRNALRDPSSAAEAPPRRDVGRAPANGVDELLASVQACRHNDEVARVVGRWLRAQQYGERTFVTETIARRRPLARLDNTHTPLQ